MTVNGDKSGGPGRVPVGVDGRGADGCCSGGAVHPSLAGAGLGPGKGGPG